MRRVFRTMFDRIRQLRKRQEKRERPYEALGLHETALAWAWTQHIKQRQWVVDAKEHRKAYFTRNLFTYRSPWATA